MRRLIILTAVALGLVAAPAAGASAPLTAYTLVVPKASAPSGLQARAVLPVGAQCPALTATMADGSARSVAMTARRAAPSTGAAFASIFVCQAAIPARAAHAEIDGLMVPASLPARVSRIALLGDTGCRLKKGDPTQNCSQPGRWPLGRVASSIARASPDVVLHIGDYFYREAACPSEFTDRCGGSPAPIPGLAYKDTQYSWMADFLLPMSPLFRTAPIVAVRGNHEACYRGGNGWYLFLDPWPDSAQACAPDAAGKVPDTISRAWSVDLGIDAGRRLHLAVVDSAYGSDIGVTSWSARIAPQYALAAAAAAPRPGRESWLLTHKPIFGISQWYPDGGGAPYWAWIAADHTAASLGHLGPYQLMVGSHIHLAQANQLPQQPPQLVVGNSGVLLETFGEPERPPFGPLRTQTGEPMLLGVDLPGNATSTWSDIRFGWVLATPGAAAGAWTLSQRSPNGVEFATCSLAERRIACG